MTTAHTFAPVSRRRALAGLGAGGLGLVFAGGLSHRATVAQEATPPSLAGHPIVGAWLVMNPSVPPNASPAVFAADGTLTIAGVASYRDPQRGAVLQGSAVGVWAPTGECGVHVTWVQALSAPDGTYLGTFTLDGYPEVSPDGQSFLDDGTRVRFTVRDAANAVVMEAGGGTGPATPPVHALRMRVGNPGFPTTMAPRVAAPPTGTPGTGTPTG